jgi:predicted nuclease of predicted toxin-antitoxin system
VGKTAAIAGEVKLLLDEHHSPRAAAELSKSGFDVLAASTDQRFRSASDEDVFVLATMEQRAIVTENIADFVVLAARWTVEGRAHSGIILTHPARFNRATKNYPGSLIKALTAFLEAPPLLEDSWIWWF